MASEFRKLQSPMQQRKQHSQISGLLVASMSNNQISDDQDDVTGRDVNKYILYSGIIILGCAFFYSCITCFRKEAQTFSDNHQNRMGITFLVSAYLQKQYS